jgi:hypothetical protein
MFGDLDCLHVVYHANILSCCQVRQQPVKTCCTRLGDACFEARQYR